MVRGVALLLWLLVRCFPSTGMSALGVPFGPGTPTEFAGAPFWQPSPTSESLNMIPPANFQVAVPPDRSFVSSLLMHDAEEIQALLQRSNAASSRQLSFALPSAQLSPDSSPQSWTSYAQAAPLLGQQQQTQSLTPIFPSVLRTYPVLEPSLLPQQTQSAFLGRTLPVGVLAPSVQYLNSGLAFPAPNPPPSSFWVTVMFFSGVATVTACFLASLHNCRQWSNNFAGSVFDKDKANCKFVGGGLATVDGDKGVTSSPSKGIGILTDGGRKGFKPTVRDGDGVAAKVGIAGAHFAAACANSAPYRPKATQSASEGFIDCVEKDEPQDT
eukprot:TRINITY_DN13370_c0_g1_i1.p1 TRINITY_DN13370_c0_g1~~TRINITY_DN13370_c0_g1_i1.p1  ORF type:complete len:327 (+),score=27.78 TRINITY_DN13370_c0_g1_i1:178-1158(+)